MTHIDLTQVGRLRSQCDTAAHGMQKRSPTAPIGAVAAAAFGNTGGSALCFEAWRDTTAEAQTAFEYLRLSLVADVGRLDAIMHTFSRMDAEAADDICAAAMRSNTLDVYNTHVDTEKKNRDEQMGEVVDHLQTPGGPAIFTGDLNVMEPPHTGRLQVQGWDEASTDEAGNPVGTYKGRGIDKVYAGPGVVVTDPARSVDGGPSDHDGLVVGVGVVPAWP